MKDFLIFSVCFFKPICAEMYNRDLLILFISLVMLINLQLYSYNNGQTVYISGHLG